MLGGLVATLLAISCLRGNGQDATAEQQAADDMRAALQQAQVGLNALKVKSVLTPEQAEAFAATRAKIRERIKSNVPPPLPTNAPLVTLKRVMLPVASYRTKYSS